MAKMLKLRSLSDTSFQRASALIYGPSGAGKTSLVRTFAPLLKKKADGTPDWSRVLLVVADPGQNSLLDLSEIQVCRLWEDMLPNELLSALYDPANKDKFDLIFIDGLDAVAQKTFQLLDDAENRKPKYDGFNVWREFAKGIRTWVTGMRDIPWASVVFVSHDQEKEEGTFKVRPKWPGGETREELCGYFDYVLYMQTVNANDAAVKGKEWPAVFITNQSMLRGGNPRYEVKCRVRKDAETLPGKMHADLADVWKVLFPKGA